MKLAIVVTCALFALVAATQNSLPHYPDPEVIPTPGPLNPNCRYNTPKKPFGAVASHFNAFFQGNFSGINSDIEGRCGAGGHLSVANFAFGCQIFNSAPTTCINFGSVSCADIMLGGDYINTVVVDKDASFSQTQVYAGKVVVGGDAGNTSPSHLNLVGDCAPVQGGHPVDFDAEFDYLNKLSHKIALLSTTGEASILYTTLTLKGTGALLEVFSVSAADLAVTSGIQISGIASAATIIINIVGASPQMQYFGMQALQTYASRILWNAVDATSFNLHGITIYGTILAPNAHIVNPDGSIFGSIYSASLTTTTSVTMQINYPLFTGCLPPVDNPPPPPVDCEQPFGPASVFDVFVCEDYVCSQSDVEGRLAAGGNITVTDFSIGCLIFPPHAEGSSCINNNEYHCSDFQGNADSVLAGNSVSATRTEVKVGNLAYGNVYNGGATLAASDCASRQDSSFDFQGACTVLRGVCDSLTGAASTGTFTAEYNQLVLSGTGENAVEVFNIPGLLLSTAVSFELKGIADKASVIINVNGADLRLGNFGFLGSFPTDYVVWNFCEATRLSFYNVGWKGAVLAPNADIVNPTGVVHGQVFAKSWGSDSNCMQQNHATYLGCLLDAPVS